MEESAEKTHRGAKWTAPGSVSFVVCSSLLPLLLLLFPACGRGGGASKDDDGTRPPAPVVKPVTLGTDGLPAGWIDGVHTTRELYFEADPPGPCPPCPPDARCSPCPPPFHRFSTHPADHPDGVLVFVAFTGPPSGLKVGAFYRLGGRTTPWPPHGDIFITTDHRPREWFPTSRCKTLVKEYTDLRDQSARTCTTEEDCTILPGGVDDCGRAMDKMTADRLEPMYQMFRDRCGLQLHCAPRAAYPACENGRCVERSGRPGGGGRPLVIPPSR